MGREHEHLVEAVSILTQIANVAGGYVSDRTRAEIERLKGEATMLVDLICLTPQERTIYQALVDAAEARQVCPNYLDLNELVGYESASSSVGVVKRLEAKGLIRVVRFQRFRRVQIVATGKWTARSPSMHVERPHVPRGARRAVPTDRKPYKGRLG